MEWFHLFPAWWCCPGGSKRCYPHLDNRQHKGILHGWICTVAYHKTDYISNQFFLVNRHQFFLPTPSPALFLSCCTLKTFIVYVIEKPRPCIWPENYWAAKCVNTTSKLKRIDRGDVRLLHWQIKFVYNIINKTATNQWIRIIKWIAN